MSPVRWRPVLVLILSTGLPPLACEPGGPPGDLFLAAAGALGPEADRDRVRVVNPILLSDGHPRMSAGALRHLQDAGYEVIGGDGREDPGKATLYFTRPESLGEGGYRVRIYVSLGARPGTMHRGDSWWEVDLQCDEECAAVEIEPTDAPGWSRTSPIH